MKVTIEHYKDLPHMRFLPPTSEPEIVTWEKEHRIKLPVDFRYWLLFSDGGQIFIPGVQLYGVIQHPTLDFCNSKEKRGDLPKTLFIIGAFSFGDLLCFIEGEDTILQWDHETWCEFMRWDNFRSFLKDAEEMLIEEA